MNAFPLLPLGAMAARLGIQPRDLREAAEAGAVPCVRLGQRGLMFDPGSVEAQLLAQALAPGELDDEHCCLDEGTDPVAERGASDG
jgi:hypothetical protein